LTLAFAMTVVAVQATGSALGSYIQAIGRMWLGLSINLLWGVVFIGLSVVSIPRFGSVGYMGSMALAYLISVIVVYGGFLFMWRHLMQCYPLCRALILFGVLMPVAIYADRHFTLPLAAGCALVLGSVMSAAVALPMTRRRSERLVPSPLGVSQL
jgi:O-antigen/teichoic acid export membrane protein